MSVEQTTYAGVDASRKGWIAVLVDAEGFVEARFGVSLEKLVGQLESEVIAIDIPIGIDSFPRRADAAAAAFVGPRRSSVFRTPPRDVLEASDYEAARQVARDRYQIGVSAQAYALAPRILEADRLAAMDPRVIEVHPEVSFAALAGDSIAFPKKTWSGQALRTELLVGAGIEVPSYLGDAGVVAPDDVLDAAVAAWSARRYALGDFGQIPEDSNPGEPTIYL